MILSPEQISNLIKTLKGKKIVLVGGCFDVIHPGHIIFLEKAKEQGDVLVVLLESDEAVRKIKGIKRPYHNQNDRAQVLSSLKSVDYVVMLPLFKSDSSYEELIKKIKPDMICATSGYGDTAHHERIAKKIDAKIKFVTRKIGNHSTSRILTYRG
ncbi:MAG: adenylyltransferase/cytidyltransferase family protein [Candidatus Daviesbacteria bacterium]|nr:adenylyltransferase/cytidyltransferase family protein [Candidatus Daviesbacteria bacterium]